MTTVSKKRRITRINGSATHRLAVNEVVPIFAANFVSEAYFYPDAKTFDEIFLFVRDGVANYYDANGVEQLAENGEPRLGAHFYENDEWQDGGIAINPVDYDESISLANLPAGTYDLRVEVSGVTQDFTNVPHPGGPLLII